MDFQQRVFKRFETLYGAERAPELVEKLEELLSRYDYTPEGNPENPKKWTHEDSMLITYGDMILSDGNGESTLHILQQFLEKYIGDTISSVHVLPFFPSTSDEGFSVIDYKQVRDDIGEWQDIRSLSQDYQLMADLVINHTSRFSEWFKNFEKGISPGKDYFIEVDPSSDLSEVTRPRSSPLLTAVNTSDGLKFVWTTFSEDQVDLDFSNPQVLFEFIDIFLFYISQGISVVRLDAVAYLWKQIGTSSIHLDETHQVVKLFRDIVDHAAPHVTLITETNVPFRENISYFGEGDETHMIYQFSLPPLLLHAILTENAHYLTKWARDLPDPPGRGTYFNFTASHDGIGVRPIEGIVPDEELQYLVEAVKKRGGFISYKQNRDGTQSPYELNITYYDAFEDPGQPDTPLQMKRFICSQILMLSLKGVPGIYFQNLVAGKNNIEGVLETGHKRSINRRRWRLGELEKRLEDPGHAAHEVLNRYRQLLNIRRQHPAFHPEGAQKVYDVREELFVMQRISPDENERILVIGNVTREEVSVDTGQIGQLGRAGEEGFEDLLDPQRSVDGDTIVLAPFETVWLLVK